jgi:hypothetical protein
MRQRSKTAKAFAHVSQRSDVLPETPLMRRLASVLYITSIIGPDKVIEFKILPSPLNADLAINCYHICRSQGKGTFVWREDGVVGRYFRFIFFDDHDCSQRRFDKARANETKLYNPQAKYTRILRSLL